MQRKVAVLLVSSLVLIFGAGACGGALTQEQSDALDAVEAQGETQENMMKMQKEQQKDIEQLQQDVAQLKQQPPPQGGETTQPDANQKGGTTEKAK